MYPVMTACDIVEQGTVTRCCMTSEIKRYQKEDIVVFVGSYIFNREIENALLGHAVFDCLEVELPDGDVKIEILSIEKKQKAEANDALAKLVLKESNAKLLDLEMSIRKEAGEDLLRVRRDRVVSLLEAQMMESSSFEIDEVEWNNNLQERLEAEKQNFALRYPKDRVEDIWEINYENICSFQKNSMKKELLRKAVFLRDQEAKSYTPERAAEYLRDGILQLCQFITIA